MANPWGSSWGTAWGNSWGGGSSGPAPIYGTWNETWGASWGYSWTRTGVTPTPSKPYPGPAGRGKKARKKYQIGNQTFTLTEDELEAALSVVLHRAPVKELPEPVRKVARALKVVSKAKTVAEPTYEAAPAFDALWREFVRHEDHNAAAIARHLAQQMEIEADDEELFLMLSMLDDA